MKDRFVVRNGQRVAVLRPADQDLALRLKKAWEARAAAGEFRDELEQAESYREVLASQPHQFVGLLGKKERVLAPSGDRVDKLRPGDSLYGYDTLMQILQQTHLESGR